MGQLVKTWNGRIVNAEDGTIVLINGKPTLLEKPVYDSSLVKSITIGRMENECTKDFGHFIGMYIGDGWVDKSPDHGAIHIASIYPSIINFYRDSVNRHLRKGFTSNSGHNAPNTSHEFNGAELIHGKFSSTIFKEERMGMMEMFGHGALNKKFPNYFLNTPEDFRWGLLAGLIDTDGTLSVQKVHLKTGNIKLNKNAMYSTTSRELADNVQLLSFSLGVNASLTICHHKSGTIEYTVIFSTKHIYENRHNLDFLRKEKSEALESFVFSDRGYYKDVIPFTKQIYTLMKKDSRSGARKAFTESQTERLRKSHKRGYIARDTFMQYYDGAIKEFYDSLFDITKQYEVIEEIL